MTTYYLNECPKGVWGDLYDTDTLIHHDNIVYEFVPTKTKLSSSFLIHLSNLGFNYEIV